MDALQLTPAAPPPPQTDMPTAVPPTDTGAGGIALDDPAAQKPLDFKALLARIKTPVQACDSSTQDYASKNAPENADVRVDKPEAAGEMAPDQTIMNAALAFGLLPAAPPTVYGADAQALDPSAGTTSGADAQALDTATALESARAQAPSSNVLVPTHDTAMPQLKDTETRGKETLAADFAARGEYLPQMAEGNRGQTIALPKDIAAPPPGTAALPVQPAAPTAVSAPPAAIVAEVSTRVGSAGWGNEVGQRMVWMVRDKQHVAELHLNPPQLGPLDIRLTVDGSQTTAVFTSPHAAVREVIMAELPRLREVLADSGITLGNASVTADTPRDGTAFASQQPQRGMPAAVSAASESPGTQVSASVIRRIGLVDLFA